MALADRAVRSPSSSASKADSGRVRTYARRYDTSVLMSSYRHAYVLTHPVSGRDGGPARDGHASAFPAVCQDLRGGLLKNPADDAPHGGRGAKKRTQRGHASGRSAR